MSGKAQSGVPGLDEVLAGGFSRGSLFLVEGSPGTGKTTLALRFLLNGADHGEPSLYITLSETKPELVNGAASHGWTIPASVTIFELQPAEDLLDPDRKQSLLYSADLELGETIRSIHEAVKEGAPTRIVIDSLSEIRLLAQNSLRYRRQLLALKHYFAQLDATVLALDDLTSDANDKTAHSIAHGVVRLEELTPEYGAERRRMRVMKYRGQAYRGGYHDFIIKAGGLEVFPRLISRNQTSTFVPTVVSSGNVNLDALLGGGLSSGSSTLVLGPAGTGKSLLVLQFATAAIQRGERAAIFIFDEEIGLLMRRAKSIGIDLERYREDGLVSVEQVDAAELTPGEFAHRVKSHVSKLSAKTVIIDSLNGYQAAMPQEGHLVLHVHELLQFLNRSGVKTFLTVAQHGLIGEMSGTVDVTYLADSVLVLRYFEAAGRIRRAISLIKKRTGSHEDTIREFSIGPGGIVLGEPLFGFQGILRGVPTFTGPENQLLNGLST